MMHRLTSGVIHEPAPPLTEAERRQMLAWNATDQRYSRDNCVPQLVAKQASGTPEAIAVASWEQRLTYAELNRRANQLAHHLRRLGVGPGDTVGVYFARTVDLVVALLGVLKAGAAYLPLDPLYPSKRLAYMLADARVRVVVTKQHVTADMRELPVTVVDLDADAPALAACSESDPVPLAATDSLAYIMYTSGSTGAPKGVQITHDSLLNLVFWHQHAFGVTPADRATQLAGTGFDAAVWELWPYLAAGASVQLPDEETRVTPTRLRDWLIERQITMSFVPTALAESLVKMDWPFAARLRYLFTGAEALHVYPRPGLPFALINNYGPTECTVVATSGHVPAVENADTPPPIGRPIANTQVFILDDQLRQVPIGAPGELYIGGAGLSLGYVNRPDLTAERFIAHPLSNQPGARLYRTGDLACYLPDGQLAFLGRVDTQVKIRGYRIELDEIASVLNTHASVQTSVVVACDDAEGEQRLVAYVVPTLETELHTTSLQEHLRAYVPDYMVPTTFLRVGALPLTPNGKIDRAALPPPDAANTLRDALPAVPRTPVEARIVEIVATTLHTEQVGVDDNFFLLGGHSLLGAQVIARVADTFGVELSLQTLFDSPTVAQLALEVERCILATVAAMSDDQIERLLE
jgi:amino acid adenylation domain-containing protein